MAPSAKCLKLRDTRLHCAVKTPYSDDGNIDNIDNTVALWDNWIVRSCMLLVLLWGLFLWIRYELGGAWAVNSANFAAYPDL